MLVQTLAAYADSYLADDLAAIAFEEKPVRYLVELDDAGRFCGIRERVRQETRRVGKKEKSVEVVETLRVPRSPVNRNSGVHPLLGCDALPYLFGPRLGVWTAEGKGDKEGRNHAGFVELIQVVAEQTGDAALAACAAFYADPAAVERAAAEVAALKPPPGALASLSVRPARLDSDDPGGPVVGRPVVRRYWTAHYERASGERHAKGGEGMCLISGESGPLAVTHDLIKGAGNLGGQAGVALMSFDKAAFRSYGWEKNANSPVSPGRASAYVLALNDLLRPGAHRRGMSPSVSLHTRSDYGGMAFLYWTREPTDVLPIQILQEPDPDNVKRLMDTPHRPSQMPHGLAGRGNEFYLLAVSGNGGRLVVRDWYPESLEQVTDNVRQWFSDLAMADVFKGGERARPPSIYALLSAVSPPGREPNDKANAAISLAFMRRALHGLPFGHSVLAAALNRLRREQGKARLAADRVALVRLCVNDIAKTKKGGPIMAECLDNDQNDAAYLCGQLLAEYEALQYQALGEVNVTVGDRYYAMASTRPLLAFKRLEDLSRAHLKRLRSDKKAAGIALQQRITALVKRIGESACGNFPAALSLEEQGRFVIGYHHQKADNARKAKEAKAAKEAAKAADAAAESAVPTDAKN
ncbi:CRISPR-associated protein, Csd1 family [Alkalidesulfovibrio alkalitolerans DSM 16529]|uniref:CRISPR-associated protein, Csd1 family n=1 Tax=Alkalidesulfovibrio alkalitolerans DSM 16529 TaxID=1121439 RepID=S7TC47_9BACT|nr:type I-C CRISPR-associated protein Cas8c/Csd1 [Alkalidesulfovibrio alkalitolerans]EPR34125.1 CRISPR-associated protein, Csd1 family [Alkalidesulfovibrio alkalitolerans DSM 16529]